MDQAKSGLMFIKGSAAEILSDFHPPPPSCQSPSKFQHAFFFLLAIWKPIGMSEMKVHGAFVNC